MPKKTPKTIPQESWSWVCHPGAWLPRLLGNCFFCFLFFLVSSQRFATHGLVLLVLLVQLQCFIAYHVKRCNCTNKTNKTNPYVAKTLREYQQNQKNTIPQESWSWRSDPGAWLPRLLCNCFLVCFLYLSSVLQHILWFYWFYWYSCNVFAPS